ncbi:MULTISPECIES: ABC transporter permease [unclassified Curtobacterium]|uniref:PhnE/PtxC family ABC transporter permease n=1 Tax=unclassified Curtobacterium TaxID=257496 RepID=UPI000F46853F|nr:MULTISPECIES: ABC transporter permease subunit [unclassified Curtobacterium]ROQ18715.1 phosphonate transport system permease protein [Curtobacterium sp. PhB171]ROQ18981.1 phosphonate transport system permease protein [Curtobacterium sp. PhB170]ROS32475.1 phosphonate transport system permease protein [Curtobacterium sp. PhB131]ROS74209.1 phosphonate transport system permease protein [Curtobacterium sp. PhB141]
MTAVTERPVVRTHRSPEQAVAAAPRRRVSPERVAAGLTLVALAVLACVALARIDISLPNMIASWSNAEHFFQRVGTVRFPDAATLLQQTALTVGLALLGTLLAAVLSVPVAYLAAGNTSPGRGWIAAARFVSVLTRAIPDVVLAMVFVLMFTIGPLPGILAIGIHSIGMISKLFADAIEQIDEGPRTAIRATGGNRLQQFTAGVLPQVLPSWVATILHRNDINLRGSVILGYVGIVGLGREMSFAFKSLDYSLGIGYAIVIFALCVLMEIVSSSVRAAMLGVAPSGRGIGASAIRAGMRRRQAGDERRQRNSATAEPRATAAPRFATPDDALRRPWTAARVRTTVWSWVAVLVVIGSVLVCDIAWGDLATVWGKIPPVAAQFWPPSFGSYGAGVMFSAMFDTVAIALAATLLALVFSMVIGSFAARNVAPTRGVRTGARFLLVVVRGIPETILAVVLIVITGLGAQAGTLALAFGGIGLLGKLVADSLEEVQPGPERALTATGATRFQRYAGAAVPQGIRAMIGHTFYLVDTNIRAATILGIVGGGGIGYYLLNAAQGSNYASVTGIVLMILVTVLVVEGIAMWMRRVFR